MNRAREAMRRAGARILAVFVALVAVVVVLGTAAVARAQGQGHEGHDHAGHDHGQPQQARGELGAPAPGALPPAHDLRQGEARLPAGAAARGTGAVVEHGHAHAGDHAHGASSPVLNTRSKASALLFWMFALMTVGGAVFVITRSNLISAVMGMVGTFFAIAALYAMLSAHFLAVIQVLVYAGAIMVLFVFVIMILNKPEDEPWRATGIIGKGAVLALIVYVTGRLIRVLWSFRPDPASAAMPKQIAIPVGTEVQMVDYGSTMAIGQNLFTDYLFPFEAVSLVLLIAIVGAIAVARPHEKPQGNASDGHTTP